MYKWLGIVTFGPMTVPGGISLTLHVFIYVDQSQNYINPDKNINISIIKQFTPIQLARVQIISWQQGAGRISSPM